MIHVLNASRRIILLAVSQPPATEPPPLSTANSAGIYSTLHPPLAIVLLALIFVLFSVGFFSIYIRLREDTRVVTTASCDGSLRRRLDPVAVEAFPSFVYSSPAKRIVKVGGFECAICLSEFEKGEMLRLLPRCGHVFHADCINGWLLRQVTCPVCRAELAPELTGESRAGLSNHVLIDVH